MAVTRRCRSGVPTPRLRPADHRQPDRHDPLASLNCYAGRVGLINSGGESKGSGDLAQAVRTAVINKRAGGTGLIVGRKAFQRPMADGVELLHAVQDVFLDRSIQIA